MVETDCPILTRFASVDLHIDLIATSEEGTSKRYLHSSPEYGMKRLISEGMGDCFQISHVFRKEEAGVKHNPEFMMAEWYRMGKEYFSFIEETLDFIRLFLGKLSSEILWYEEAFKKYTKLEMELPIDKLLEEAVANGIAPYPGIEKEGKDAVLNLLWASLVEPELGKSGLTVITGYPPSQAALAKVLRQGEKKYARRFEVYYLGVELANGYDELADPVEQRKRFILANEERKAHGKETLPIDEHFLAALEKGFPSCCGVAVGFDRLMMLRHRVPSLKEVLPFDWETA
jgi:lysyl-tRNA synthetase class 2